jgi:phytoene desaturase
MSSKVGVIGSGFAGLSAAAYLAKNGCDVSVFEKNENIGGRARNFESNGFIFDMGPSWYWMPDVFERFFNNFGYQSSDFYELKKLDPNFKIIFSDQEMSIPANWDELVVLFENTEKGAGDQLVKFMKEAKFKYDTSMSSLIYQPANSILEFIKPKLMLDSLKLQLFSNFRKHVRGYFKDPKLISIMEFPILFLGAMPKDTPALYSLMNYSGLKQGTFYPMGGFAKVQEAIAKVAKEHGVDFRTSDAVKEIEVTNNKVNAIHSVSGKFNLDAVIGAADYEHIESKLLPGQYRNYSEVYWDKKTFAPSCLLFYIGVDQKVPNLDHHNLFFDEDYEVHGKEIYEDKQWPTQPLFYVCAPSKTDQFVAPEGKENLFILMPIAPGVEDTKDLRAEYYSLLMSRLSKYIKFNIEDHVITKRSYCINDFEYDYNAYKGNAYGLANTLMQTAHLKPKIRNKKISNLFYAGQLTVPGPGVPPSIISGEIAANQLVKSFKK